MKQWEVGPLKIMLRESEYMRAVNEPTSVHAQGRHIIGQADGVYHHGAACNGACVRCPTGLYTG